MTGNVSWETLLWVVGIIGAAGATVAGFLFAVWRIVEGIRKDREEEMADLGLKIEAVDARAKLATEMIARDFAEYQRHAGETFATKTGVSSAVERVENSVNSIALKVENAVDRLSDRIDRLLEGRN
jgi:ubiquinone biosynthesis protein UbiJ